MGREESRRALREDHPNRRWVERGYPRLVDAGEALRRLGVAFLDASTVFAKVDEPLYIDSCCHFNFEGNRILARQVAAALASPRGEHR